MHRIGIVCLTIALGSSAGFGLDSVVQEQDSSRASSPSPAPSGQQSKNRAETPSQQARSYPPKMEGAVEHVLRAADGVSLSLYAFNPDGHKATDQRPAIVCFFGGGWRNGSPSQFEQQCRYLASRGMVAITADYRVSSRHDVKAVDCVKDAKSAMRWVRGNAQKLGIDPARIAAAGGSAGGHLAACTAVIGEFNNAGDDLSVSAKPDALVLFNPAVSFDPKLNDESQQTVESIAERMGAELLQLSPAHHVRPGDPPTLVLIGTEDFLIAGNRQYVERMKTAGNRCELDLYEGMTHGFFNFGRNGNAEFRKTLASADRFLTSLGYLQGPPKVDAFFAVK